MISSPPSSYAQEFPDPAAAAADPVVADAVRLLNRRRRVRRTARWMFAVNALLATGVAGSWSSFKDNGPVPPLAVALAVTIGVTLVATMVAAMVGWARCDKAAAKLPPDLRDVAESVVSYQRRNSFPVKFVAVITMIVAVIAAGFFFGIPLAVNGAAYLAGAGQTVTFTPESYNYACDSNGDCTQVTQGTLGRGGSPTAYTLPHAVRLHHPFQVQLTLIRWPTTSRIYNDADARTNLIVGLILVVFGVLLSLLFAWRMLRVSRLGHW